MEEMHANGRDTTVAIRLLPKAWLKNRNAPRSYQKIWNLDSSRNPALKKQSHQSTDWWLPNKSALCV
jgi:hypothetical protein